MDYLFGPGDFTGDGNADLLTRDTVASSGSTPATVGRTRHPGADEHRILADLRSLVRAWSDLSLR